MILLDAKYVMVEPAHLPGFFVPVILPACLEHKMAAAMGQPVSAGFCRRLNNAVETYGTSSSLNLSPHARDAELIARWFSQLVTEPAAAATNSPKEGAKTHE